MPRRTRSDAPTPSPMAASTCSAIATSASRIRLTARAGDATTPESSAIDWHRDPVHGRVAPALFWSEVPYLDPACGDHKIIWELNRHQHFLAFGRAWWLAGHGPARATFVRHLASWMDANPPLVGINWASMLELALRSLSWIWALELFVEPAAGGDQRDDQPIDAHPWLVDLLLGLDRQLHLVEQNLSTYFSPNTHLLGEALALYVAGRTLPELRRAPAWAELGRRILIEEMSRQISPDGGHVERSFHYHRYTLDFYLLALAVARADRRRHAALRRSGPAAGPLRADHRRRSRTPGADRRRRRRPAVSDLRPRQRGRQRLAGAGRLAARRSARSPWVRRRKRPRGCREAAP